MPPAATLGVSALAGDTADFLIGHGLADDVTDIELRVIASSL